MDFEGIYEDLKKSWSQSTSQQFIRKVEDIFAHSQEPYLLLMMCIRFSKEIYYSKNSTMTAKICFQFEKFITKDSQGKFLKTLTTSLQQEAFYIATKIKHKSLFNTIINCFHLSQNPDLIFPLLQKELVQGKTKEVCNFALKLDMHSKFSVNELLVPLLLEDAIPCLESFLDSSLHHREPFLNLLDKIVGGEILIGDLIQDSNVRNIRGMKSSKIISKLGQRLMKKYNINVKVCPNMIKRQILGSVRYLFHRKYVLEEMDEDSFICFIRDIAKETPSLRADILDLFVDFNDCHLGNSFLKLVDCKDIYIPYQIKEATSNDPLGLSKPMTNMQIEEDWLSEYYPLKISLNSIHLITKLDQFDGAMDIIASSSLIAIDSEWKPSFHTNAKSEVALIQIATREDIFLFDMIALLPIMKNLHWQRMGSLFSNRNIRKLVYGFRGDVTCLSDLHSILSSHLKKSTNFLDLDERKRVLDEYFSSFFTYKADNEKGLSELVYLCFGKPLNKKYQFSYWSARPLSKDQIIYAALDAYCLLDIEKYLDEIGRSLNIGDWKTLKKQNIGASKFNSSNFIKANESLPIKQTFPPTPASQFKVVCDNMVQGLGRLLRHCNIDTAILESNESHEKCVSYYEKERRVALTRGNVYHHLCQYIPESHVHSICSDDPKEQLRDVVATFNIVIRESDVFARCANCNNSSFLQLPPTLIEQMMRTAASQINRSLTSNWIPVKGGEIDLSKGLTHQNVKIGFEEIHANVLEKVSVIYVCNECGKCYWDGSHFDRVVKNTLSHVVQVDVPCLPVPSPPKLSSR